ncbi:MAG: hypothetical protein LKI92_03570 [Schleiferilactobacillus harbinensis]|jgi:hypothetical protein|nr:hypothetical protein [Schleiferilactobacillus harbinensis]MCI1911860.1 hypothetical protein [Schleiferilactobacillus harbinensis]
MAAEKIGVGDKVTVRKSVDVPMSFKGTVMKVYTNSALISIDSYQQADQNIVTDLKDKTIINFKHIRVTKSAPKKPVEDEESGDGDTAKKDSKSTR